MYDRMFWYAAYFEGECLSFAKWLEPPLFVLTVSSPVINHNMKEQTMIRGK